MSQSPDKLVAATWSGTLSPPGELPGDADVAIVGGGIVGVSTAWFLARRGVSVVLCEKGHVAGEQSGRNWGWVRVQGRDPREVPMMLDSLRIWRGLAAEIGSDVGFREGGCLFAARSDKDLARLEAWCDVATDFDLPTRMLDTGGLTAMLGDAASQWRGALYTATDGRAEPHLAAPAIARAAAAAGARIVTGCAVRGILREAGRVCGMVTECGEVRAPVVVCAAGAWSSTFCRSLGIDLPQLRVRGTVARTAPGPGALNGNLFDSKIGIRRRLDGGYTVAHGSMLDHAITPATFRYGFKFLPALRKELGVLRLRLGREFVDELRRPQRWDLDRPSPFESERVLNPEPSPAALRGLRQNLASVFPELGDLPFVETWAGMVETTPDVVPVIGEAETLPGLVIATGFSGHGFGLGPGAGRAIAALVSGDEPPVDLDPFRRSRFYDGSPIRPYTAI